MNIQLRTIEEIKNEIIKQKSIIDKWELEQYENRVETLFGIMMPYSKEITLANEKVKTLEWVLGVR